MGFEPEYVVPSGEFIADWMEETGVGAAALAERLGVSREHVSQLLQGQVPLTHETARQLEHVTGIPARLWNQYEAGYREALSRASEG